MPSELAHDVLVRTKALDHHGERFGFGHAGREDVRGEGGEEGRGKEGEEEREEGGGVSGGKG